MTVTCVAGQDPLAGAGIAADDVARVDAGGVDRVGVPDLEARVLDLLLGVGLGQTDDAGRVRVAGPAEPVGAAADGRDHERREHEEYDGRAGAVAVRAGLRRHRWSGRGGDGGVRFGGGRRRTVSSLVVPSGSDSSHSSRIGSGIVSVVSTRAGVGQQVGDQLVVLPDTVVAARG